MSASFYAKNAPACSSPAQSTACGSPFDLKIAPRTNNHRSHTAEKGYRNMGNIESSFFYERPPKEEVLRERVQSPYMEGRKNNNYINPTFHSSIFINQTMQIQRSKTPDVRGLRRSSHAETSQNTGDIRCVTTQTPREAVRPVQIQEAPAAINHAEDLRPVEVHEKNQPLLRKRSVVETSHNHAAEPEFNGSRKQLQSSKSEAWLDVCTGCHNWNLADEVTNARRKEREAERELERSVLELNSQLLRADQEKERARKELVVETSNKNYDAFSQKRQRDSSAEGKYNGDYNVDIKPHNKNLAAESLKCLQRYQSMMDKMYEASTKKNEQRRTELGSSQLQNRNAISRNEYSKVEEKKSGTHVKWDLGTGQSLFDKINNHADGAESHRAYERRKASEHNCKTGLEQKETRKKSPLDVPESPFKTSSAGFEKSTEGKSILDKMYQSSLDYWKKQKQNLSNNSQFNKSNSALRKSRREFDDDFDGGYTSPVGRTPAAEYKNGTKQSLLDKINDADQQSAGLRQSRTRDCSRHNKSQGFFEENAKLKTNLETYYNSPTKKVGQTHEVESAGWTEDNKGVFHKINESSALLDHNRRLQLSETGSKLKQQMAEGSHKKKEQQIRDKNFREEALLVCSHKANLMYCNLCNRKVPMNKITKVVADYNKLIKNRQQRSRK